MIEESAWDILLALHSDRRCDLSLAKLASLVSVTPSALNRWLADLEDRKFITGAKHSFTGELRAVLTPPGTAAARPISVGFERPAGWNSPLNLLTTIAEMNANACA